jgi:GTP:adenosylcobinamide-phosphate guanylyltransferase
VPSYCLDIDGREVVLCGVSIVHRETMLSGATLSQGFMVMEDDRFGLNVNTREEMVVAEELLRRRKGEHHP